MNGAGAFATAEVAKSSAEGTGTGDASAQQPGDHRMRIAQLEQISQRSVDGHWRLLDDSFRAGVWPDSVQVSGGKLSLRLPTR